MSTMLAYRSTDPVENQNINALKKSENLTSLLTYHYLNLSNTHMCTSLSIEIDRDWSGIFNSCRLSLDENSEQDDKRNISSGV